MDGHKWLLLRSRRKISMLVLQHQNSTKFNQILGALKDITLDINTGLLVSSGFTINGDLTVTGIS